MRPLKHREIFGYTVGDLGINLNFQMVSIFLAYFYTDVFGISPAHVAGLFLAARVWDAVNDPIMGYLADRTRSRWGRFRPYLLFGAIPLNLAFLACYFAPDLSPSLKVVYAYGTYILHGMVFTAVGLPYSSISAAMTQSQQERSVIAAYRMFFAVVVGVNIVSIAVKPLVSLFATEAQGFRMVAAGFGIASTLLLWFAFTQSKERVAPPRESYRAKDIVQIVFKNDALLVLAIAMLLNTCVWVVNVGVTMYFFKYIVGDADLTATYFMWLAPANILGVVVAPLVGKKVGKAKTFIIGSAIVAVFYAGRELVPSGLLSVLFAVSIVGAFGQMLCSIMQWGMLPDTVEYGEWRTGIRSEGIPFAFFSFVQKAGMALGGFVTATVLDQTGYVANQDQTDLARSGIEWLFNLMPAAFSVLCLVALLFYRLDSTKFQQVLDQLSESTPSAEG